MPFLLGCGERRSGGAEERRSWGAEKLKKKRELIIFGYKAQEIPTKISFTRCGEGNLSYIFFFSPHCHCQVKRIEISSSFSASPRLRVSVSPRQ
ncbi:MAG: hypothetical protein F6K41_23720 [Symploca sp. SIO3E6]|nr:hypothetical protein [Caldora sp. SIO3E6]